MWGPHADQFAREKAALADTKAERALDHIRQHMDECSRRSDTMNASLEQRFRELSDTSRSRHDENRERFTFQDKALNSLRSWVITLVLGCAGVLICGMATVIAIIVFHSGGVHL